MRRMLLTVTALVLAVLATRAGMHAQAGGQSPTPRPQPAQPARPTGPPTPVFTLADHFLQWRLLPGEKAYEVIDGARLLQYVNDLSGISRHYRDSGHPQFWGRVIGSSADQESAQWLMSHMTRIGLTDVHMEPIDLAPQWFPQSWELTATGGGKSLTLATAQPA